MSKLHLVLKDKWFNMIYNGVKNEEYRTMSPYWNSHLLNANYEIKRFDSVVFHKGYSNETQEYVIKDITIGYGDPFLGAPADKQVYIIKLGQCLQK